MMAKPLRLIPYVRVSKVAGRSGDSFQSPDQQLEAIMHAAALKGAKLTKEIRDLDESGGTMNRPGLKEALALMESGGADGIVVAKLDRFARDPAAIGIIEAIERSGKLFVSAADAFDTSTSVGKFALGMMVLVAKLERDRHIEQWDTSTRKAVARGVHTTIPYGYRRSGGKGSALVLDEPAATIVRRIFAEKVAGNGIAAIADGLNADGIPAPRNPSWTRQTVRAITKVRTYVGEARYGEHVQREAHPQLVSEAEWESAQPRKWDTRPKRGASLLAGVIRCSGCGYVMGASATRWGRRYNCNRHHATGRCPTPTSALAEALEALVVSEFLDRYAETDVAGAVDTGEVALTRLEWDRLQREYVAWRDDTTLRAALGDEEYRAGLVSRKQASDDARWAHEEAVREAQADGLSINRAVWAELSMPEQRELLRSGIDAVLLSRAASSRSPLAGRLDIRWTGEAPDNLPRRGRPLVVAGNGNP